MSVRAIARGVRRALTVVVVAVAARNVLGVLVSSIVLTGWALWAGLAAWARLEDRLDRRRRVRVPDAVYPRRTAAAGPEHVAFARGLAAVSAAYLDHCEQEAGQP